MSRPIAQALNRSGMKLGRSDRFKSGGRARYGKSFAVLVKLARQERLTRYQYGLRKLFALNRLWKPFQPTPFQDQRIA